MPLWEIPLMPSWENVRCRWEVSFGRDEKCMPFGSVVWVMQGANGVNERIKDI